MKLSVLNVAYPFAPVREDTAGGAEQVLLLLDAALVRSGHRSFVIACEGSSVKGELFKTGKIEKAIDEDSRRRAHREYSEAIEKVLSEREIDVIHMHGLDFESYLPGGDRPVLVTLHLPPGWYKELNVKRPGTYFNCVSLSQARGAPPGLKLLPEIENGVPVKRLFANVSRRRFVMSIGRICPEKGFHLAMDAARALNIPFLLAGDLFGYDSHEKYFRKEIKPRLGHNCRFLGPVGFDRKRRLLSAARCVIIPSLVPETSSLAAMEALSCGTPVVANDIGALSDIVENGKTGFLVRDSEEMKCAIAMARDISSDVCRAKAEERFSSDIMTSRYIALYERLVKGSG
ncbi:MAG: glycosyltransferase [Deltaproteobacteria bacterium]|nr:glycosyltransferase [Deltaproteobacteria bacterium]